MNFPISSGLISDDAHFFFEDYNFYYNATVNPNSTATNSQSTLNADLNVAQSQQQSVIQQNLSTIHLENNNNSTNSNANNFTNDYAFDNSTVVGVDGIDVGGNGNFNGDGLNNFLDSPTQNGSMRIKEENIHDDGENRKNSKNGSGGSKSNQSNKTCRVCGDKALGYNFNVVTCESCKAFFRRNALKKKKLQCPFQNRCTITVSSRRYCQKCRLKKCFSVGMRAEYIMTEEQRAQKRQRLLEREAQEAVVNVDDTTPDQDVYSSNNYDDYEPRDRFNSGNTTGEFKSSKSSVSSSETYRGSPILHNSNANRSAIVDVASWVADTSAIQPPNNLISPTDSVFSFNAVSASLDNDEDSITVRLSKAALHDIISNHSDRTQQATALGHAVITAASSALKSKKSTVKIGNRHSNCACPCTCASSKSLDSGVNSTLTTSNSRWKSQSASEPILESITPVPYPMDTEPAYGAPTAECQMASMFGESSTFSLFPVQCTVSNQHVQQQPSQLPPIPSSSHHRQSQQMPQQSPPLQQQHQHLPSSSGANVDNRVSVIENQQSLTLLSNDLTLSASSAPTSTSASKMDSENQMPLYPVINDYNLNYAGVSVPSPDFDLEIINCVSSAFDLDWQFPVPFPSFGNFGNNNVTNLKYEKLDELLAANEEWDICQRDPRNPAIPLRGATAAELTLQDIFNLIGYGLRATIRQHRRLSAFRNLPIQDQQALIKATIRQLIVLRAITKFDERTELIRIDYPGRDVMALEVAKRVKGGVYDQMKEFIMSFPSTIRADQPLMLIVSAVALFNPEYPQIMNKQQVANERQVYLQLLKDYLQNRFAADEATKIYDYLLDRLQTLVSWVENYMLRIIFDIDPNTMDPIVFNVYDFT